MLTEFLCPHCNRVIRVQTMSPRYCPHCGGESWQAELMAWLKIDQKISAIKVYRTHTGLGLAEAKTAVEAIQAGKQVEGFSAPKTPEVVRQTATPPSNLREEMEQLIRQNNKIMAIKICRERTGLGLKESKDIADALQAGKPVDFPLERSPLPAATVAPPPSQGDLRDSAAFEEVKRLAYAGKLIEAIKIYREKTGLGLKESKQAVEAIARGENPPSFLGAPVSAPAPVASAPLAPAKPAISAFRQELIDLIAKDEKIEAIHRYRMKTGSSLFEAKQAMDTLEENPHAPIADI